MKTRTIRVRDASKGVGLPEAARLAGRVRPAVRALRKGRLVGFPTETVYGVGVVATDGEAVARLRELKRRPRAGFTVHIGSPEDVWRYVAQVPPPARTLMSKAWPGPVTVILPAGRKLADPALAGKELTERICPGGRIGLRCVDEPAARAILTAVGEPVLATSANLAGQPPARSAREVLAALDGRIDLLVDAGRTRCGESSTVVAFDGGGRRIVRKGAYDSRQIERLCRLKLLFVCTGNTCRSAMAEALARKLLAEHYGCRASELAGFALEAVSAGVFAAAGAGASTNALIAAGRLGASAEKHRTRKLTNSLIDSADLIFCMTRGHVSDVVGRCAAAAEKTSLLDAGGNIADPIGGSVDRYVRLAERMVKCLRKRLKENLL